MNEIITIVSLLALVSHQDKPKQKQPNPNFTSSKRRKGDDKMKRTYSDITGEYYDSMDQLNQVADEYGLRAIDMKKAFFVKPRPKKIKLTND